jgi:excisionase family DNA binding protein
MEDAGRVYFDLLKKITEELDRRKLRGERVPEPKMALDLAPKGEPPTLSVTDVAEILQVSPDTVRRLADKHLLGCAPTPGGHRRFRVSDVERYFSEQRDGSFNLLVAAPISQSGDKVETV